MRHKIVLSSFIFALFSAVPAAAQNECGAQSDPGNPETIDCAPGDYNNGITYSSDGDLTLQVPDDSVDLDVDDQGIAVTGNGGDNIAWDSSDFVSGSVAGNAGALIDYHSAAGDIDIRTGSLDTGDNTAQVTHAIRAESTDGGDIHIETNDQILFADTGIEALTDGDIDIVVNDRLTIMDTAVRAVTGAGSIDLTVNNSIGDPIILDTGGGAGALTVEVNNFVSGGLEATSGAGPMTINVNAGGTISNNSLTTVSGSDAEINMRPGSQLQVSSAPGIDMNPAAGTVTTLNNEAVLSSVFFGLTSERVLFSGGGDGQIVVNNGGGIFGGMDFSGNDGGVVLNNLSPATHPNAEGWTLMGDTSKFGAGDDVVNNLPGALVVSGYEDSFSEFSDEYPDEVLQASIDFGSGEDLFDNAGILGVGAAGFRAPSQFGANVNSDPRAFGLELASLEKFDNNGLIVLGPWVQEEPRAVTAQDEPICHMPGVNCAEDELGDTDGEYSDVLSMSGTAFDGGDGSAILLDAAFSFGTAQTNCQDRAPREGMFRLPGADCVDLSGGSTSGTTEIIVRDRYPGDVGAHNPDGIVVIDVSGGESAAGHFTLSPESDGYDAVAGGIDKGLFTYSLAYDPANQQHKLIGLPGRRALRMPLLVQAAQATSRTAADGWFNRRGDESRQIGGDGTWARLSHDSGERDARQTISAFGATTAYRNDFDQDITSLTLGRDLALGDAGDNTWLVGGMLGYARTRLVFGGSSTRSDFDGVNAGVYGAYTAGAFFVDAMANYGWLQVKYDDPTFSDPAGDNNALRTQGQTLSARTEAGWRIDLTDTLRLEPLAGLSWIQAEFDELEITSADAAGRSSNRVFGGSASTSLRAALGARASFAQPLETLRLSYALTGRVWEELDGETDVLIRSTGPDATVRDEFDGTFGEVAARIDVSNPSGSVSGYLSADGTFGDDYDSLGAEVGFRYQW